MWPRIGYEMQITNLTLKPKLGTTLKPKLGVMLKKLLAQRIMRKLSWPRNLRLQRVCAKALRLG